MFLCVCARTLGFYRMRGKDWKSGVAITVGASQWKVLCIASIHSCSRNLNMFARPLHFCCQQLSQASCSTTGSTKIEGKSSLKDARTGHDDEIASKSSENRSGLSRAGKCQRGRALKSCSNNRRLKNMQVMFARPLHFCCQQLSQASCSTTGSTKIEGKSSLKDARTGHDDEIASKSSENRSGLSNSAPRVA